jgi:tRNA dimethylallyltransferase
VAAVRLIAVVGPTAAGKSDLAMTLARAYDGEIVNADAMQLYRGLDIGTAKATPAERAEVPHHLLDVLDVTQSASVAAYQRDARAAVERVLAAGRTPVLVGGSGLYVQAVVDELEFPGTDPALRAELAAELERVGPAALHARLATSDPAAAAAVLPSNGRRIVRALEVIEITGGPYVATLPDHRYVYPGAIQLGLDVPRPELDERIGRRVDRMFEAGFVDEVRGLLNKGLIEGKTANRALGYSQVIALLNGEIDEVEARERTAQATRRFARRQDSWFRKDQRISWLPYDDPDLLEKALEVIAEGNRKASSGVVGVEEGPSRHTGAVDARG